MAFGQRPIALDMFCVGQHGEGRRDFVRLCLHGMDSKVDDAMSHPLGDLVYGTEVGDVLHFNYINLGERGAISMHDQVVCPMGAISMCWC